MDFPYSARRSLLSPSRCYTSASVRCTTARWSPSFQRALQERREEEEEELDEARRELRALLAVPAPRRSAVQVERHRACMAMIAAAHKRKRKKRRKKKTPRTSSLSLHCRARRRLRQWHVQGWSFWCCSSRCVPVVGIGSGVCWLVLLVTIHLRAVFPSIVLALSVAIPVLGQVILLADEARGDSTGAVLSQGDMPVVVPSAAFGETAQKTVEIPQLPFFDKLVQISVVVQRPIPMVLLFSRPW